MNIDGVIGQLKSLVPTFGGNVAGAAAYAKAVEDQVWLPQPAAYVIPLDESAEPNQEEVGLYQLVTERIGVIVDLDNSADRRGQTTAAQLLALRYAVYAALLNWRPDWDQTNPTTNREARGLYYAGGRLLDFDRARFFYQFEFALDTTITDADGWQLAGPPLTDAFITVTDPVGGETLATGDAVLTGLTAAPSP
ncbi:MAG TPA: hypothetical protein VNE67_08995 [Acetobacteraceae bacterium]|nr:hypothetical protein [Acetobacteraceae bacterium]